MAVIPAHFKLDVRPVPAPEAMIVVGGARFSVLTDRLIRMEYEPEGRFEDRASLTFWYREQAVPSFDVRRDGDGVEIETEYLHLKYSGGGAFTEDNLTITLKATGTLWHPGMSDADNLGGTTRTLDYTNGYKPLEPGLMSRAGWAVIDDSAALVMNDEGWPVARPAATDVYFFGYGHEYKACLVDYCKVSGQAPMIPRWALGNWWSRYWAYTQDELTELIEDFDRHELPFSVLIVDMDWHVTKTGNKSSGWTGYTWDRQLFPDPEGFIRHAHDQKLKISLNLHPAEGIHPHEEQYAAMAERLGIDPKSEAPVVFEITDPAFAAAYFEVLHHPYEKMGVDFWWIDWQQGQKSALAGLDPLWLINHLHFYDLGRDKQRRPFIFSRWGREGHQRYPIGFSGDTYVTWESLAFQSYMTPTASNIAYGWWSHDIGGHTGGVQDTELFARWVQFGALSPINRLHVTKGMYHDRRPWILEDAETLRVVRDALQLRHAFVPYLYTMARRAHAGSVPLTVPMYYEWPEQDAAYACPQQYLFGTELIAAPFVAPADETTGLSRQVVWLPEGEWTHFFTGEKFDGDRWHPIYGKLSDIPLFAKAGAIVPLAAANGQNGTDNPDELHVHVFAGASNEFALYEDDGESTAYGEDRYATTVIRQTWRDGELDLYIDVPTGDLSVIPAQRTFHVHLHNVRDGVTINATAGGQPVEVTSSYDAASETLMLSGVTADVQSAVHIIVRGRDMITRRDRKRETLLRMLRFFKLHTAVRNRIGEQIDAIMDDPSIMGPFLPAMSDAQGKALFETICEAGIHHVEDTQHPDLLVLWNNRENPAITFRYSHLYLYFGGIWENDHSQGVLPRMNVFTPPAKAWRHGAQGEHTHTTLWRAQVDYMNLYTVREEHRDNVP
jgi:alpha-glucosidase (family GH31 glycosyl hydrolase)